MDGNSPYFVVRGVRCQIKFSAFFFNAESEGVPACQANEHWDKSRFVLMPSG